MPLWKEMRNVRVFLISFRESFNIFETISRYSFAGLTKRIFVEKTKYLQR